MRIIQAHLHLLGVKQWMRCCSLVGYMAPKRLSTKINDMEYFERKKPTSNWSGLNKAKETYQFKITE
jgi:hypothetical protein